MNCPNCHAEALEHASVCSKCGSRIPSLQDGPDTESIVLPNTAEELPTGTMLAGKFRILGMVGRGGMGIIYKAEDVKLHRPVALKFLPPALAAHREARERFVVEARAAAALAHPNICTIHEIHDDRDSPFIEMEYIEGQSLRGRIQAGPLEPAQAVDVAIQIAEGLEEAHAHGIVHRDIKSSNVMVTGKGQAKIMDFGLAKLRGETLHTRAGTTLGTVAYMSPEQARGGEVDHRTDLWSLGVVLYEMLSGSLPFTGDRDPSILYAVVHEEPKSLKQAAPHLPPALQQIVNRALKKRPEARYPSAAAMQEDLRRFRDSLKAAELERLAPRMLLHWFWRPRIAAPALACLALLLVAGGWLLRRQSRIRWARDSALPEMERLLANRGAGFSNLIAAYRLAETAEKYIPGHPRLAALLERCSVSVDINTDPPGAAVYIQDSSHSGWQALGTTPIKSIRLPAAFFSWRIEKPGYETILALAPTFEFDPRSPTLLGSSHVYRILDAAGKLPPGMVHVPGSTSRAGPLPDFYIDRYEVTNRQYKQFVNAGGYKDRRYWKHPFLHEGRELTWEQAMSAFTDQTGRPGPAIWSAGEYPKAQDDYPVGGVSWYEAAAYAEYSRKSLPTTYHWGAALGLTASQFISGWLAELSNFSGDGPAAVASYRGMSPYGAYDMAGNVREWCWNQSAGGRMVRGGAWNDIPYMTANISQAPALDRSAKNGFRCVLYPAREKIPERAFEPHAAAPLPDFYQQKPVSDSVFQVYREQFSYDKSPLDARVEWRAGNSPDWLQEEVSLAAAYGNERLPVHLFLPRKSSPPYQAVVYFPGAGSVYQASSRNLDQYLEYLNFLAFLVKNGRAVVYPIYKGTFERREPALTGLQNEADTRQYTEYTIQLVKDLRRSIDYLETRQDIDAKKLAYYGLSWGGRLGAIIPAVEERFQASVLVVGGLRGTGRPEVSAINYVSRVRVPTLMLNGRYDMTFPFETSVKPMFDLLGTPAAHKRLQVYNNDHFISRNEMVKETLDWLDRYLGPVK